MFRKFFVALSLVGLLGIGGLVGIDGQPGDASIMCIDCWEMKIR